MECQCGAPIEAWREQCEDCDLADVMGGSEDRRWTVRGSGMASERKLRSKLRTQWGHERQFYVLRWRKRGLVKIGSTSNLERRIQRLELQAGEPLELVAHGRLSMVLAETGFHAAMESESEKFSGEWYYWTPRLEALTEKLKAAIPAA